SSGSVRVPAKLPIPTPKKVVSQSSLWSSCIFGPLCDIGWPVHGSEVNARQVFAHDCCLQLLSGFSKDFCPLCSIANSWLSPSPDSSTQMVDPFFCGTFRNWIDFALPFCRVRI